MERSALIHRIEELKPGGDQNFVVSIQGQKYEFKLLQIAGNRYKVMDGYGISPRVIDSIYTAEQIADEFIAAIKGVDFTLEEAIFLTPYNQFAYKM